MKFSLVLALGLLAFKAEAQRYDRGYDLSSRGDFLKKGTWMAGGTANYSLHHNDNYQFLIAEGINSTGYNLEVSPAFCYMIKDNMGLGVRMDYTRNMFKLDEASLNLGEASMQIHNYH